MGCNCGKKKLTTQPKKVIKSPGVTSNGQRNMSRRIIRRAAK